MHLQGELDELEREEFFRLKKVQKNKQKVAARDLAAKEAAQVGDKHAQQQQQTWRACEAGVLCGTNIDILFVLCTLASPSGGQWQALHSMVPQTGGFQMLPRGVCRGKCGFVSAASHRHPPSLAICTHNTCCAGVQ
jgi:hypothetical protein